MALPADKTLVQRAVREAWEEEGHLMKKRIDHEICKTNMQGHACEGETLGPGRERRVGFCIVHLCMYLLSFHLPLIWTSRAGRSVQTRQRFCEVYSRQRFYLTLALFKLCFVRLSAVV